MRTPSRARGIRNTWAAAALLCAGLVWSVTSASTGSAGCTASCSHQYNASMRAESHLHVANVQGCGTQACRATETTRHDRAVRSIQAGRDFCHDQCPAPGRGNGSH